MAIGVLAVGALVIGASWAVLGGVRTTAPVAKNTTVSCPKVPVAGQKVKINNKNNIPGLPAVSGTVGSVVTYGEVGSCQPPCALMGSVSGPDLMSCMCPTATAGGGPVEYSVYWSVAL